MKMRNKISCLTILLLCFGVSFAFAESIDVKITEKYDKLVKEYVLQQANCIDNGVKFIASENASEDVNNYLICQETTRDFYLKKDNYNAVAEVLDKEQLNDVIYFKVNVKADWVYEGSTDSSSYAKDVDVLVDKNTGKIIDYYDMNSFTLAVRGEVDIKIKKNRLTKELVAASLDKYETKISDTKKFVEESVKEDNLKLNAYKMRTARASYSWIDHDAVVQWARANYYKSSPTSGRPGTVSYYDFSQIPGAYDCTNFISHALLSGGARIYDTSNSSTGWWFWSDGDRSYSWSGVNEFYNFAMNNQTKGPGGYSRIWTANYEDWSVGDILQMHNGSIWRHSTVITGFTMDEGGTTYPRVTGRTSATSNNNNKDIRETSYYPNAMRVLHLYNYGA